MQSIDASEIYEGSQPVRVLWHNVINALENINPGFKADSKSIYIGRLNLNPAISIDFREVSIYNRNENNTPYIVNNQIHIQETFGTFLWAMAYCFYTYHDEAVRKPASAGSYSQFDMERLGINEHLFAYAFSLRRQFTPFDKMMLPNPEMMKPEFEDDILKTNNLYAKAYAFWLLHEVGHLVAPPIHPNPKFNELAADDFAFEQIKLGFQNDGEFLNKSMSTIIALSSALVLNMSNSSVTHPNIEDRILNFMNLLKLDDNNELWAIPCFAFRLWALAHAIDLDWGSNEGTYKDLFYRIIAQ